MTEDFAISFVPAELETHAGSDIPPALADEARADLAGLGIDPAQITIARGSHGYGAEVASIVAIVVGLFLLAKPIDENLAAWVNLAGRVRRVVDSLVKKRGAVTVSEPVAVLLALDAMGARHIPLDGASLVAAHTIPVANGVIPPELLPDFRHQSDRFYILVFRAADQATYIVVMRSSGEIEEFRRLPTAGWSDYFGIGGGVGSPSV